MPTRTLTTLFFCAGFAFLFLGVAQAQPPETLWTRTFGEEQFFMEVPALLATPDGGVVIAATANGEQSFLVKYDSSGNQLWNNPTYLNDQVGGIRRINAAVPVDDGQILCTGWGYYQPGWPRAITCLYNASGDTVWRRAFDTLQTETETTGMCCLQREDGAFIVAGTGRRNQDQFRPPIPIVVCYSHDGDLLWSRYYFEYWRQHTESVSLFPLAEGGIGLTTMTTFDPDPPQYRAWALDDTGAIVREIDLLQLGVGPSSIFPISQENVMFGGYTCRAGERIARLDSDFEVEWLDSTIITGIETSFGILGPYLESNFMLGWEGYFDWEFPVWRSRLVRVNGEREIVWTKQFADPDSVIDYMAPRAAILTDGSICVAYPRDISDQYIAVARLARDTVQTTVTNQRPEWPESMTFLRAYPNPFNSSTTLSFDLPSPSSLTVTVFDITGREVMNTHLGTLSVGSHSHNIDATQLPSGIYFARLSTPASSQTTKLALIR